MSSRRRQSHGQFEVMELKMETPPQMLPHFIIIGAMKCGTTTLYRHLDAHPDVDMSRDKETDFFVAEKSWDRGLGWYEGQFSRADAIRGEASPNYTKQRDFAGVADRMAQTCPDAKLIYILRDPVARAESQFRHSVIMGQLDPTADGFAGSAPYNHIMDASFYAAQLKTYYEHFPKDSILVLDFDELRENVQSVMDKVHAHIGASARSIEVGGKHNDSAELSRIPAPVLRFAQSPIGQRIAGLVSRDVRDRLRGVLARGRNRTPAALPDALLARMREELAPDVAQLRDMTGQTFAGWSV